MAEVASAALELGLGSPRRPRRERLGGVAKAGHRREHGEHLLGILLPIGRHVQPATARIAAENPDTHYVAVEVHAPGVGSLLRRVEEEGLTNVRVVQHDAVEVLREMIPPGSLAAIHVFFPDPWPKKRHHKRRLVQPAFAALAAARLSRGGRLHVATDWQEYAQQVLAVLGETPGLRNTAEGFAPRPPWRPETKFERRGRNLGHGVWDVLFEKE